MVTIRVFVILVEICLLGFPSLHFHEIQSFESAVLRISRNYEFTPVSLGKRKNVKRMFS